MFAGKETAGKWKAFKNEIIRVQRQYVPVRLKGKAGSIYCGEGYGRWKDVEINSDILKNVHITQVVVLDVLKHAKVDKSPGRVQVYPRTLWEARKAIAGPVAEIFASSIATGEVLEDRRLANVVPLFKEG
eukprot:g36471.t1